MRALVLASLLSISAGFISAQEARLETNNTYNNKAYTNKQVNQKPQKSFWQQFKEMFGIKDAESTPAQTGEAIKDSSTIRPAKKPIAPETETSTYQEAASTETADSWNNQFDADQTLSEEASAQTTQQRLQGTWEKAKKQAQDLYEQTKQIFTGNKAAQTNTASEAVAE